MAVPILGSVPKLRFSGLNLILEAMWLAAMAETGRVEEGGWSSIEDSSVLSPPLSRIRRSKSPCRSKPSHWHKFAKECEQEFQRKQKLQQAAYGDLCKSEKDQIQLKRKEGC